MDELFSEIETEEEEEGDAVDDAATTADASGITSFYEYPTFVGAQRMSSEDNDEYGEYEDEGEGEEKVRSWIKFWFESFLLNPY